MGFEPMKPGLEEKCSSVNNNNSSPQKFRQFIKLSDDFHSFKRYRMSMSWHKLCFRKISLHQFAAVEMMLAPEFILIRFYYPQLLT